MLTKRIIACLDIKDGRTVKGVQYEGLRDAGDPVELGARYAREGADEVVFLDITATNEKRRTLAELVKRIARELDIPFTVGGGISAVEDVAVLLEAGADKVSVNSAAVKNPGLVTELAKRFGSQCIVLAIDGREDQDGWWVYTNAGKVRTQLSVARWAAEGVARGAGEILFTSMSHDGTRGGYAVKMTSELARTLPVPVIASGGAGALEHFAAILGDGGADAALASSVFHFESMTIPQVKEFLAARGIPVRRI